MLLPKVLGHGSRRRVFPGRARRALRKVVLSWSLCVAGADCLIQNRMVHWVLLWSPDKFQLRYFVVMCKYVSARMV